MPPKGRRGDFSSPVMGEVELGAGCAPLLVTNSRGDFVPTIPSRTGIVRYGFSQIAVSAEGGLFRHFFERLGQHCPTRCRGIAMAQTWLRGRGIEARTLIVSMPDAVRMLGVETVPEGVVGQVLGMRVVVADIPESQALVAGTAEHLGQYTRVGEYLGLLFRNVDRNLVRVDDVAR